MLALGMTTVSCTEKVKTTSTTGTDSTKVITNYGIKNGDPYTNMGDQNAMNMEFATKAAINDMFEIMSSEMAIKVSHNTEIINFAKKMLADHKKTSEMLKPIAMAKGITLPTSLPADKRQMLDNMQTFTGHSFDKAYMDAQQMGHQEAIEAMKMGAGLDDAELKNFAKKQLANH